MFSSSGQFRNCLRLSCGVPWSDRLEQSIAMLGSIASQLASTGGRGRPAYGCGPLIASLLDPDFPALPSDDFNGTLVPR
jgi:hypothetical protein